MKQWTDLYYTLTLHGSTVRDSTGQYGAVRGSIGQYRAVRGSTGPYGAVRGSTGQYGAVRDSTGQYGAVRGSTGQYGAVRGSTGQYAPNKPSLTCEIIVSFLDSSMNLKVKGGNAQLTDSATVPTSIWTLEFILLITCALLN